MADLSNNSFIPKRGPAKRRQGPASRQVYAFTIISYVLMFATLLSTGGVYLYGKYIEAKLQEEIVLLNNEKSSFNEADLKRVTEFDSRLSQANDRLENSVSIVSIFEALERATIGTVQLKSLNLTREGDEKFVLQAAVITDSFDSTIFQRGVFQRNSVIESVSIGGVHTELINTSSESNRSVVSFTADLEVPLSSVPYTAKEVVVQPVSIIPPTPEVTEEIENVEAQEVSSNEENI